MPKRGCSARLAVFCRSRKVAGSEDRSSYCRYGQQCLLYKFVPQSVREAPVGRSERAFSEGWTFCIHELTLVEYFATSQSHVTLRYKWLVRKHELSEQVLEPTPLFVSSLNPADHQMISPNHSVSEDCLSAIACSQCLLYAAPCCSIMFS